MARNSNRAITGSESVAEWIDLLISGSEMTMREIAQEIGFAKPNIMSMIRKGDTKLPISKIGKLAKVLRVDPAYMLERVLKEYDPETWATIKGIIGPYMDRPVISQAEYAMVEHARAHGEVGSDELALIDTFRKARPIGGSSLTVTQRRKLAEFAKHL